MNRKDMTASPDKFAKGTGAHRTRRPVYMDFLPPCNNACPAGEDIQGWLALAQAGQYEAAWQKLIENNPFPAIHGRVCYHPCETACNRVYTDEEVSIHAVERLQRKLRASFDVRGCVDDAHATLPEKLTHDEGAEPRASTKRDRGGAEVALFPVRGESSLCQ